MALGTMSKSVRDSGLIGLYEVSKMLGLSRPAVKYRSHEHQDFPEPLAQLRSGPHAPRGYPKRYEELGNDDLDTDEKIRPRLWPYVYGRILSLPLPP